jgi:hypothetical protein
MFLYGTLFLYTQMICIGCINRLIKIQ